VTAPTRNVAILVFDDVEVLDFCGPFEVFGVTGRRAGPPPFEVFTVAEKASPVLARNGLSVNPSYSLPDCPASQVLVIPGGYGTRREMHNSELLRWIGERQAEAEIVLSVCTGALLLARAGLLDGLSATTHFSAIELLREAAPRTRIESGKRFADNGRILVAAGISAGIDASLHAVSRLLGEEVAVETAQYMEYDWKRPAS